MEIAVVCLISNGFGTADKGLQRAQDYELIDLDTQGYRDIANTVVLRRAEEFQKLSGMRPEDIDMRGELRSNDKVFLVKNIHNNQLTIVFGDPYINNIDNLSYHHVGYLVKNPPKADELRSNYKDGPQEEIDLYYQLKNLIQAQVSWQKAR